MSNNKSWSFPGGYNWNAFISQMQLFANICQKGRKMDLRQWNDSTFKEAVNWGEFLETMHDQLTQSDKDMVDKYLCNPNAFTASGQEDGMVVVEVGITLKILSAAGHFLLRQFMMNSSLKKNHVLLKAIISRYLKMIDSAEELPEAIEAVVKDLSKQILPFIYSFLSFEWIAKNGCYIIDGLQLGKCDLHDEELRYFLGSPDRIGLFGVSRCLIAKLECVENSVVVEYCGKLVKKCRMVPSLLEVIMLAIIDKVVFMQSRFKKQQKVEVRLSKRVESVLIDQILLHDGWLNLWNSLEKYLLVQVAARNAVFCKQYEEKN